MHFVWTHGTRTQDVNEKAGQRESHWIYTLLVKKNHHCFCPKHRQTVDDFNSPLAGNIEIASKVRRQLVCIVHVACRIAPFLITLSELRGHSLIIMLLNAISRRSHSAVDKSSTDSVAQSVCDSRACFRPHRMRSEYVQPIATDGVAWSVLGTCMNPAEWLNRSRCRLGADSCGSTEPVQ